MVGKTAVPPDAEILSFPDPDKVPIEMPVKMPKSKVPTEPFPTFKIEFVSVLEPAVTVTVLLFPMLIVDPLVGAISVAGPAYPDKDQVEADSKLPSAILENVPAAKATKGPAVKVLVRLFIPAKLINWEAGVTVPVVVQPALKEAPMYIGSAVGFASVAAYVKLKLADIVPPMLNELTSQYLASE